MKIRLFLLSCLLLVTLLAEAQEVKSQVVKPVQFYIGIQPGFRPGPFMEEVNQYPWDINIIPITFEFAVNRHLALRIHPIWDIELRPYPYHRVSAAIGVEIAAPIYLSLKNTEEGHRGFYLAPVITPGYNKLNDYNLFRVCGELGFSLLFAYRWSFSIAAQSGVEFQKYPDDQFIRRVSYTIPVIALGIWL
ncbi:MAG: hypothetical protein NTV01_06220 [Bacteroidia bacterium]|nr:hypothetical protein [Bacteroidia bacterium]